MRTRVANRPVEHPNGRSERRGAAVAPRPRVLGHHLIADMWECRPESLTSVRQVERVLRESVDACHAHLIDLRVHSFTPTGGVTGIAVILESHISVHTWPELGYAAVDVFTCGETDAPAAVKVFEAYFHPRRTDLMEFKRGVLRS